MKWQAILNRCKDLCTLQRSVTFIFSLSLLTLLFTLFLYPTNSTDLGWHLKYGEYFAQYGRILKENTFSFTMPGYVWTNHSWVYDILTYFVFKWAGFYGLAFAGGLVGLALTALLYKLVKVRPVTFLLALVPFYLVVHTVFYHGFRAQTASLVLFALAMLVTKEALRARKQQVYLLVFTSILFLFWANWHGEYLAGLTYILIVLVGETVDEIRLKHKLAAYKKLLPVICVGFGASLLTPFGLSSYAQGLVHAFSARVEGIIEWSPWPTNVWVWWVVVAYACVIGWNLINRTELRKAVYILPFVLFGIQAFLHRRMQGMWAVVTFPLLVEVMKQYKPKLAAGVIQYLGAGTLVLLMAWKIMQSHHPWIRNWDDYCVSQPTTLCSEQMTAFLHKDQPQGKMFNYYNWGGYLIWRHPEQKVYIDGRMTSWKNPVTGVLPYTEYETILKADAQGIEEFKRHGFSYAVLPRRAKLAQVLRSQLGWVSVYEDPRSVVVKPINN